MRHIKILHAAPRHAAALALLVLSTGLLAGCETDGTAHDPISGLTAYSARKEQPAKPAEPPMTHTRAAEECWMATEKGHADMNLDKRADVVDKCIDEKMKAAQTASKN